MRNYERLVAARDLLLRLREDLAAAGREFQWPRFEEFNWARDYFDVIARDNESPALRVVSGTGADESLTFAQLARRSSQVANFLSAHGVGAGDRILIMLANVVPLWETMLAAIKLGAVIIPATTLLERTELRDRLERGSVKVVVTTSNLVDRFEGLGTVVVRVAVGEPKRGWLPYEDSYTAHEHLAAIAPTRAEDLLLLYFTSGTTAQPKLVAHTHASYPVGHLSTMYWLGLRPGDVHLNLSSPGWAKHAWSSFFAPWNAQACALSLNYERFDARAVLDQMSRCGVTTFCAPPTVWRLLIQQDLASWRMTLREATSAGEPLNPEVIERVRAAWGITVRDGFGQTETTAQVGNPPGLRIKPGSMGRPLPGCPIVLVDLQGKVADEGEVCVDLGQQPLALMRGYFDDPERNSEAMADGYYHTGDIASRDAEGYLTYVGRMDDVFKSSDYRISPFELESVLIEHAAVSEAAIVPAPDPVRLCVPKAFIELIAGATPDSQTALSIFRHIRTRLSPYKRIRRLEFAPLPKTISGKIRRVELRRVEVSRPPDPPRNPLEFWEEDFPDL
ncbi:MAG TPA: AMP-binding protein [Steroidobacteraceae bacterium]|jgi:acetyl-CoA synthetase|nr:AMP-binding protein [Steroidobacteraceae bacterium]